MNDYLKDAKATCQAGFTIIELLITVSVLAILAAISAPSFTGMIASNQQTSSRDYLLSSIALARSEAIKRGSNTILCARDGALDSCVVSSAGQTQWQSGWLLLSDENQSGIADAGDTLLQVFDAPKQTLTVSFTQGSELAFNHRGRVINGAGTFSLTSSNLSKVQSLEMLRTGRVRMASSQ